MMTMRKDWLAPWLAEPLRAHRATYIKVAIAAVFTNIFALATSLYSMTVYNRIVPNNAGLRNLGLKRVVKRTSSLPKLVQNGCTATSNRPRLKSKPIAAAISVLNARCFSMS